MNISSAVLQCGHAGSPETDLVDVGASRAATKLYWSDVLSRP